MLHYWKSMSIRKQFLFLGVTLLLSICLLLGVTNFYMSRQLDQTFEDYILNTGMQINARLTGFSEQIHRIMMNLAYDPVVQDCLAAESSMDKFSTRQLLVRRLSQSTGIMDGIRAIVVRSLSGTPTSDSGLIGPMDISLLPEPTRKVSEFMGMFSSNTIGNPSATTIQYYLVGLKSYSVRQNAKTLTELGSVFMMLDGARIGRSLGIAMDNTDTEYFLLDAKQTVIYGTSSKSGEKFNRISFDACPIGQVVKVGIGDIAYYASRFYNQETDMSLISLTPSSHVLNDIRQVARWEGIIFFILVLILILILIFLAFLYSAVRPISVLGAYIDRLQQNLGRRVEPLRLQGNREVNLLAKSFNGMLESAETLNSQIIEAELYKKQSEIAMLRSQINPHFLYNTLETIKGMAFSMGNPDIIRMVGSMSKVYRYSLKGAEFVTLRDEVGMLADYLAIQQIRFNGRYEVEQMFDQETMDRLLPRMLLQPLVENALQHGLEVKKTGGLLFLGSHLEGGILVISIQDNGIGFDPVALENLRVELAEKSDIDTLFVAQNVKVGILNVHGRIKRYYGPGFGLLIESRPYVRTTVTIRIPAERETHVQIVDRR